MAPSTLKGCVGTLKVGYIRNVPLPRVPRIQSASLATLEPSRCIMARHEPSRCTMVENATAITYYSKVPRVPTWSDLTSLAGNVADMSRHVADDTSCRSNFGQMGPCRRNFFLDVVAVCVGLSRHLPDF